MSHSFSEDKESVSIGSNSSPVINVSPIESTPNEDKDRRKSILSSQNTMGTGTINKTNLLL